MLQKINHKPIRFHIFISEITFDKISVNGLELIRGGNCIALFSHGVVHIFHWGVFHTQIELNLLILLKPRKYYAPLLGNWC